jgi:hypothetical protein
METCKSPRTVICVAYHLALKTLPEHACKFSRHDFTLAQLFACLVIRETLGLSFRRAEALLADAPDWLAAIGLDKAPDHNTLWRASARLVSSRRCDSMLTLMARLFAEAGLLDPRHKPLTMDSTCFEPRHRSRHYDRRCRRISAEHEKVAKKPGKWGKTVNAARSRSLRRMPKLALAVDSASHLILSMKVHLGNGSDAPDFDDLLFHAWRRADVKTVVADAGYDSEANHCIARLDMGVRSIIPPGIGRPTDKPPSGRWRRHMAQRFARKADKKIYGQRSQSETVNSMIKRNQGESLRSRTPERRKKELMFKALVHNILLLCPDEEG